MFDGLEINWAAITSKISKIAKTDLGDILIAVGTGMNALRKAKEQREELEDSDDDDEYEDDDE